MIQCLIDDIIYQFNIGVTIRRTEKKTYLWSEIHENHSNVDTINQLKGISFLSTRH